ncbi:MAG: large conductance mechanosensitive channel protein MscL [Proteobacteria bacterium]|nr:large conductance mechanosensitive channel protein MscL [Pseudomonadota bacterium]
MSFFKDFSKFIQQGNIVDLAVAFIIGVAFSKIISSLVDGIIMPVIGIFLGGIDIAGKSTTLGSAVIKWGQFLQNLLDFVIIALVVFWIVRMLVRLKVTATNKQQIPKQELLLTEIRDILKQK